MRNSDKNKQPCTDSLHDKIVNWLYNKLKDDDYIKRVFKVSHVLNKRLLIEPQLYSGVNRRQACYMDVGLVFNSYDPKPYFHCMNNYYYEYDYVKAQLKSKTEGPLLIRYELKEVSIYFEVKSKLNVSEVVRQINHIRGNAPIKSYIFDKNYVVVAPPAHDSNILAEQKIGFIPFL